MNSTFQILKSDIVGVLNRSDGNPRNSEGSFIKLSDGRIAFAYSRYCGDSFDDHAPCDICAVYSTDNGKSFDTENIQTLVRADEFGMKNVMSVTLRYMNNGDIGLFYILKHKTFSSEYRLRRYGKDFSVFLSDIKCFPNEFNGYFVINNDRVLHTVEGKWIVPAALHHTDLTPANSHIDPYATVYFFCSDDDGASFHQLNGVLRMEDTYSTTGMQEPGVVELPNKVLYAYARTDRFAQYEAISIDGGENWFGPKPSRFTSPVSPMLIKQNPYTNKFYAVWNPTPICPTNPKGDVMGRTPFVMAQSEDGIHFSKPEFIETDPTKGYCYPAIEFLDDKTMLLAYCSGGKEEQLCLNRTVIRKIIIA